MGTDNSEEVKNKFGELIYNFVLNVLNSKYLRVNLWKCQGRSSLSESGSQARLRNHEYFSRAMGLHEMTWGERNHGEEDPNVNPRTLPILHNPTEREELQKGSGVYSEIGWKPRECGFMEAMRRPF